MVTDLYSKDELINIRKYGHPMGDVESIAIQVIDLRDYGYSLEEILQLTGYPRDHVYQIFHGIKWKSLQKGYKQSCRYSIRLGNY